MKQPIRILQLTDLHLFNSLQTKLLGFNPYDSLQKVMELVLSSVAEKKPSLVALTGDISQDYSLGSYKIAQKIFSRFTCPTIAIMGNHDYPPMFAKIFGDTTKESNKIFDLNRWRFVFLNSHWSEHVGGQLTSQELEFLRETLVASLELNVLIFVHHPVFPVGSIWLDKIMLSNAAQLLDVIDRYSNIKAVICGHVHQETIIMRHGISYLSTPSTSWQFAVNSPDFKLDSLMPGYRWFDLYDDGTFKTEVVRIDYSNAFIPDLSSKGY